MGSGLDQVFAAYDRGSLSRRDLLSAIASFLAVGGATVTAQTPPSGGGAVHLNHINLRVEDVQRSHAFYQTFFGLSMTKTPTYHALDCGNGTFMSLQTKADVDREKFRLSPPSVKWARTPNFPAGTLEHFCLEIDNFDIHKTREALRAASREAFIEADNLFTSDPDGILVQVVDSKQRFSHER